MFGGAIRLLVAVIFSPQEAWKELSAMKNDNRFFTKNYLFPTFILIALFSMIGGYIGADEFHMQNAIKEMVVSLIVIVGSFIVTSFVLNELLGGFSPKDKNVTVSRQFVAYASAMIYLLYMLVGLLNDLFFLWTFAIYTVYLVYIGSFEFIKLSDSKRNQFVAIASLLVLVVPYVFKTVIGHLIIKA